jgi:hypothetical protein
MHFFPSPTLFSLDRVDKPREARRLALLYIRHISSDTCTTLGGSELPTRDYARQATEATIDWVCELGIRFGIHLFLQKQLCLRVSLTGRRKRTLSDRLHPS